MITRSIFSNNRPEMVLFIVFSFFLFGCEKENDSGGPNANVTIELLKIDFVTQSSATFIADVFGEVDFIGELGFTWGSSTRPEISENHIQSRLGVGIFSEDVNDFSQGNSYYVRAYYKIQDRVFYSNEMSFETPLTVTDNQDNEYNTVKIGNQLWLMENLKTTSFNNGDPIRDGTDLGNYSSMQQPKLYFNYDDDPDYVPIYGHLYTWYTVVDRRGVCPDGWKVPDILDWEKLSVHLDALTTPLSELEADVKELSSESGGMLKKRGTLEAGDGYWYEPNGGATNITKLGVLPSGVRDPSGAFDGLGYNGGFWSVTSSSDILAEMFYTHYFNGGFYTNAFSKYSGYAVRCMKDID